jgi:hypothetical protein
MIYLVLALATIAIGLWVHGGAERLGADARDVLGDALWAVMIAWWVGVALPGVSLIGRSGVALAICAAVEISQLIHTHRIDAMRQTTLGGLVLGSGFDPRDLLAYAIGVSAAAVFEWMVRRRRGSTRPAR